MRIFFVGIHSKPNMQPLDSRTKTGKIIDAIIDKLEYPPPYISIGGPFRAIPYIRRTNLSEMERMPIWGELPGIQKIWMDAHAPVAGDLCILLGRFVHENFPKTEAKVIKLAHPASSARNMTKEQQKDYITKAAALISEAIKLSHNHV